MISVDESLFIQIVNFLFLVWVLNLVLFKPVRDVLLKRKDKMNALNQGIASSAVEIKEKDDAFTVGIREARAKGMAEKKRLMQAAVDEEKEIVDEINKKAQAQLAEIHDKISAEAEVAKASLEKDIDSFAFAIGKKILGRTFS